MLENVAKKEVLEAAMQHACSLSSIRRQCVPVPESTTRYQKVSERYRKGTRKFQKGASSVRGRNAGAMLTSHSVRRLCAWAVSEGAAYLSNASEQQEGSAASLSRLPPAAGASNLQLPLKSPPVSCCVMLVVYFIYRMISIIYMIVFPSKSAS